MLVVVHPGSACGSADFNLGMIEGARARERLARTISSWAGDIIVVDGELSDELNVYAHLGLAIANAETAGKVTRVSADAGEPTWADHASSIIKSRLKDGKVHLTGAWHHGDGSDGCIDHLARILKAAFKVDSEVLACSLTL